jgi:hypothetical protein
MIVRAEDFSNKNIFFCLVEEAQTRGLVLDGPISWDEDNSVVDLNELELEVSVTGITGSNGRVA